MARVFYAPQPTITADEELIAQAIGDGTYFVYGETPTGAINGSNKTFTLASTPNPSASLKLILNGVTLKNTGSTNDYTLSGDTITMAVAPESGDTLIARYVVSPV